MMPHFIEEENKVRVGNESQLLEKFKYGLTKNYNITSVYKYLYLNFTNEFWNLL